MAAKMLDGRALSAAIKSELSGRVATLVSQGRTPNVVVVRVGDDPGAVSYGNSLAKAFDKAGMQFSLEQLDGDLPPEQVAARLDQLSADPAVHGIMLQEPVPAPHDAEALALHIAPHKDLDGVHPTNAGSLFQGRNGAFVPATAEGGLELLLREGVELKGKQAVVIGRSTIVGRPLAMLLLHQHATVTICHSRTRDLAAVARTADILCVAVGRPWLATPEFVKSGAVVLDFGVNFVDGEMRGDVHVDVANVAGAMTPTPGGTGPVTTAILLRHAVEAAEAV